MSDKVIFKLVVIVKTENNEQLRKNVTQLMEMLRPLVESLPGFEIMSNPPPVTVYIIEEKDYDKADR